MTTGAHSVHTLSALTVLLLTVLLLGGCSRGAGGFGADRRGAVLEFKSFDGGGPEYSLVLQDPSLVKWDVSRQYAKANHEQLTGAGYTVIFRFTGLQPGETVLTVQERSPIAGNLDRHYRLRVDEQLQVSVEALSVEDLDAAVSQSATLVIEAGGRCFYAALDDTDAAAALAEHLSREPLMLELSDHGGFEKVGSLPWTLPVQETRITTQPGDILLSQGDRLCICCGESTQACTRLAGMELADAEDLLEVLGSEAAAVCLWVEWSE